jgi:hypothetical protein
MHPIHTHRTLAILAASVLAAPALAASKPMPLATVTPQLVLSQTSQDGGTVEEGAPLKYRFTLENRGDAALTITDVKPSCGCTATHFDREIPPGKRGVIEAELKTRGFRGLVRKHLTVLSNDPTQPKLELTLAATITPLVAIDPAPIALLSVGAKPVSQVFTLQRSGNRAMKLLEVLPSHTAVTATAKPLAGVGRYQVTVTASPQVPLGRTPIPVRVRTDDPTVGDLTLHVIVDRGIVAMPPMLFISVPAGGATTPPALPVTLVRQGAPFRVKQVAADDPKLVTKVQTVRDGQEYTVTVMAPAGWTTGQGQKQITVRTDDPTQPEVTIPVMAVIQREP